MVPSKVGIQPWFLVRDWVDVKSLETENFLDDFGSSVGTAGVQLQRQ